MGVPAQRYQGAKFLDFSFQDQDSCSSQSTGQSYISNASFGESDLNTQSTGFAQSGFNATHGKYEDGQNKFISSVGTQNYILPPLQTDYNQTFPQLAVPFHDQPFNSVMSAFVPQAMVMGMMPARVPLPHEYSASEPIFVNAKQYHGILRRRQRRAKLEAQNKLAKNRKPYLHESRHQHALKRARGSGGRFLNTKSLQESKHAASTTEGHKTSASKVHQQENHGEGTSHTSCSDVTNTSTSDEVYHPLGKFRFSAYSPCFGHTMQGAGSRENFV